MHTCDTYRHELHTLFLKHDDIFVVGCKLSICGESEISAEKSEYLNLWEIYTFPIEWKRLLAEISSLPPLTSLPLFAREYCLLSSIDLLCSFFEPIVGVKVNYLNSVSKELCPSELRTATKTNWCPQYQISTLSEYPND